jgi:hypothetical protein
MSVQFLDRAIQLPASSTELRARYTFDHWMMTDAERSTLAALLQRFRPACAIEIGTYRAGSLSVIAQNAAKVYSLDIDPACKAQFAEQFGNVDFRTGDSSVTLPIVLDEIRASGEQLGFVLIDGNHSEAGVRDDVNRLLAFRPTVPLYVVMHDSFNPGCRRGIRTANWSASPYVHLVELDWVHGRLMPRDEGPSFREMWCGFGLAVFLPEPREGALVLHENESIGYRAAYWASRHPYRELLAPLQRGRSVLGRVKRKLLGA